jgi:hypothetical protein
VFGICETDLAHGLSLLLSITQQVMTWWTCSEFPYFSSSR